MAMEIRGLRHDELEEHSELVYESYLEYALSGERPFLSNHHWWLGEVTTDPYYDPEVTRVMWRDGRMVASVTNFDRWVHVADGRRARVSCIGSVCTHPDYRRQGLVREVLAESIEWMLSSGFHWSFLSGAENVYGGSGWTVLTTLSAEADLQLRADCGCSFTDRPASLDDLPALCAVYDRFNAGLTGTVERTADYWRGWVLTGRGDRLAACRVLTDSDEVVGYYWGGEGAVGEIAWSRCGGEVAATAMRAVGGGTVRFPFASPELIRLLRGVSEVQRAADIRGGISLHETYRGLWRYIGPGADEFPEITDTTTLKRFLRDQDYAFWRADHF